MRVLQVVSSIAEESSGPSHSVPGLCSGLSVAGCDVSLYFAGEDPHREISCPYYACPMSKFPFSRLARSPKLLRLLKEACRQADVIHSNGLWMYPNVYPSWAVKGSHCKLVTAPRGTLAAWSLERHKWRKRLFGICAQYAALNATDLWHATSEKEYGEIRAAGYRQPVAIVSIGIDVPEAPSKVNAQGDGGLKRLVFFGRLHKVKAVDNLIMAWEQVASQFVDWELVIAGPDGGVRGELEALASDRRIPRVTFVGELKGLDKYAFLAEADLCVLPSHTENFGVTVAESLSCGTPVIASEGTPWAGLVANAAGWWIPVGVAPLVEQLRDSLSRSAEELHSMGANGRAWMRSAFTWQAIGRKMKMAYEWLLSPKSVKRPDWVVVE